MWFTFLQPQVPNSLSPDLVISPVHLKDAGFYICRVNCGDSFEFSQWAQVDVLNVDMSFGTTLQFPALCTVLINTFDWKCMCFYFYFTCMYSLQVLQFVTCLHLGNPVGIETSNLNVFPNKAGIFLTGCSRQHIDDVSPPHQGRVIIP